jgi:hypothetical protein
VFEVSFGRDGLTEEDTISTWFELSGGVRPSKRLEAVPGCRGSGGAATISVSPRMSGISNGGDEDECGRRSRS